MRATNFRPSWFSLQGLTTAFSLLTAICFINGAFGNETLGNRTPNGEAITLQKMISIIEAGTQTDAQTTQVNDLTELTSGSVTIDPWLETVLHEKTEVSRDPLACAIPVETITTPLVRETTDSTTPTAADLEKVKILYNVASL